MSWFSEAVVAPAPRTRTAQKPRAQPKPAPAPNPRPKAKRRSRPHGAIAWIAISAILLAGVVSVNLAVLRLNLQLDSATSERAKLRAGNAALSSQLSSKLASPRIQALARQQGGLVGTDPGNIGYIDLGG